MEDFEEQSGFEIIEQTAKDNSVVASFLRAISDYFGFEFDEELLGEAAYLTGYLRACSNHGSPADIMMALREYYEDTLRNRQSHSRIGKIISLN